MANTNKAEAAAKAYADARDGKDYEKPNDTLDHALAPQGQTHREMINTDRAASEAYDRGVRDSKR